MEMLKKFLTINWFVYCHYWGYFSQSSQAEDKRLIDLYKDKREYFTMLPPTGMEVVMEILRNILNMAVL